MRSWWITILIIICFWQTACNSASGSRQDNINDATQYFSLLAQTFVQFFQNDVTKCSNFNKIYDQLSTAVFDCDTTDTGKFNLLKNQVSCTDGSPIIAFADFTLEMEDCDDDPNHVTVTGPLNFSLNFTSSKIFVLVSSPGVVVNDINFVFQDMEVQIKFSSGNLECDGELMPDDETCSVKSNCEECN